jgi:DNA-binding GntR family transcriptional regulator
MRRRIPFSIKQFHKLGTAAPVQKALSRLAREGVIEQVAKKRNSVRSKQSYRQNGLKCAGPHRTQTSIKTGQIFRQHTHGHPTDPLCAMAVVHHGRSVPFRA